MVRATQKIAFVIPAYNEAAVIGNVINSIPKSIKIIGRTYSTSVVVVDDASIDDTVKKAEEAGAYVIRHILNSRTGAATATGLNYASSNEFDIAATLDADGQHDPDDVIKGAKLLLNEGGDLLIGSRLLDSAGMSRVKVWGNRGLSFITYLIFGIRVTDSQSGLRIFSKRAMEELRWKTSGYEFASEMLWRAKQLGLDIREFPIQAIYTDYSMLKGQSNWNAFNIVKSLLKRRVVEFFGE